MNWKTKSLRKFEYTFAGIREALPGPADEQKIAQQTNRERDVSEGQRRIILQIDHRLIIENKRNEEQKSISIHDWW